MNKELENYKKAIESFRKFIKLKEDENDFLYESEEFYKNDIEQNELLLKMLHSVLNYIENLEKNYENLVRISIETAFDEKNEDTEFLLRCLLKQGKISLNKEKQEYENPQKDKEFDVIGIKFEREKCFLIEDDKLDEYTKQLEYKLENSIPKKKIEEKIEETTKRYNEIHTKHLRDCGIAEQRALAQREVLEELLEGK